MRRRLLLILLLLASGAIVNVAVAWACAVGTIFVVADEGDFTPQLVTRFAAEFNVGIDGRQDLRRFGCHATGYGAHSVHYVQAGVPWKSLEGVSALLPDPSDLADGVPYPLHIHRNRWVIRGQWNNHEHYIPLRPIWPGFAINTVFYAAVLWLLFAGPFVVRRWRRIRRGLCPKCAYDLRDTPEAAACPECGAPHAVSA